MPAHSSHSASIHSRASKREPSPSPLEKSTLPRITTKENASFFAPHSASGIIKSKAKGRLLKRKQRLRIEQGKEKAENIAEKIQVKVQESERKISGKRGRRAKWEELNETIGKEVSKPLKKDRRKLQEDVDATGESDWEDEHGIRAAEGIDMEIQEDQPSKIAVEDLDDIIVAAKVDADSPVIEDEVL